MYFVKIKISPKEVTSLSTYYYCYYIIISETSVTALFKVDTFVLYSFQFFRFGFAIFFALHQQKALN